MMAGRSQTVPSAKRICCSGLLPWLGSSFCRNQSTVTESPLSTRLSFSDEFCPVPGSYTRSSFRSSGVTPSPSSSVFVCVVSHHWPAETITSCPSPRPKR